MKNRCYYTPRKDNKAYRIACEEYIERHGIKNGKRDFDNVIQRQVVAFLMTERGCGRNATGQALGVDHSTITYSEKKIKNYMAVGDKEVGEAIEYIRKEIETILNNNQKNEKKMRPYYLNANSNYPAMTQEQWERAPFNQPTNDDMEFNATISYEMKVSATITTDEWYEDDGRAVIGEVNSKTPDITPEDFVKFTIGMITDKIGTAEKNEIRKLKEMLAYAKSMEFEHLDTEADDIYLEREIDYDDDRYDEIRERELFGE